MTEEKGGGAWSVFWRKSKRCYVLSYKAIDGKFAQKYCPREFGRSMKGDAKKWAHAWLTENESRALEPARRGTGISVRDGFEQWLAIVAKDDSIQPSTLAGYRSVFTCHVTNEEGLDESERIAHRTIADVGTDMTRLKAWFFAIRRKLSAYRARTVFSNMKLFFDEAIVQKWLRGQNPFQNNALVKCLPPLPTKREAPPVVVPIEHAQALIADARVPAPRRVRYVLAFTSGDRDGELAGLSWQSMRLDASVPVMEVERAFRLVKRKGERLGPLKTRTSARTMPLHPAAVAALRWWRDSPEGAAFYLGRTPVETDPVFPSERHGARGAFARPRSADKIREDLGELGYPKTGAKDRNITMHSARKTFLSALERAHVAEPLRKTLAGHGITDVTHRHYTAEDEARLRELAVAVATVPLRWEDPGPARGGGFVPGLMPAVVPPGTKPTTDLPATSGDDNGISDNAPVAQWIEQRFPKAQGQRLPSSDEDVTAREHASLDTSDNAPNPGSAFVQGPAPGPGTNDRPGPARAPRHGPRTVAEACLATAQRGAAALALDSDIYDEQLARLTGDRRGDQ